jgi:hypothetical protein
MRPVAPEWNLPLVERPEVLFPAVEVRGSAEPPSVARQAPDTPGVETPAEARRGRRESGRLAAV